MQKLSMAQLNRATIEEFKSSEKSDFCFILDNIRSMNNIGSVFRTSDAFKASAVYLCGITAKPPHRDIEKTALGATESVVWEYHENTLDLIQKLKKENWTIVSIEQVSESILLNNFSPKLGDKYAFIMGNEVFGVDEEVVKQSDFVLEIPQFGTKHSLNVSVTAGIVAWDFIQKTLEKF
jgi:23S rRNA (guanosine2251-2'-O)-methyltransferase